MYFTMIIMNTCNGESRLIKIKELQDIFSIKIQHAYINKAHFTLRRRMVVINQNNGKT